MEYSPKVEIIPETQVSTEKCGHWLIRATVSAICATSALHNQRCRQLPMPTVHPAIAAQRSVPLKMLLEEFQPLEKSAFLYRTKKNCLHRIGPVTPERLYNKKKKKVREALDPRPLRK